jgi:hypothetical protein
MTAQRYRKKPVEIDAMQFDGTPDTATQIIDWALANNVVITYHCPDGDACRRDSHVLHVSTLEGTMTALPGDWIIRGVAGEFYPCKPAIFAATYEPAVAVMADLIEHMATEIVNAGLSSASDPIRLAHAALTGMNAAGYAAVKPELGKLSADWLAQAQLYPEAIQKFAADLIKAAAHPRLAVVELPEPDGPLAYVNGQPSGIAWRRDGADGGWATIAVQDRVNLIAAISCLRSIEDFRWAATALLAAAHHKAQAVGLAHA